MPKAIDISKNKYDKLTPIQAVRKIKNNTTILYWICKCDCGNITKPILTTQLVNHTRKSCGCLHHRNQAASPYFKGYKELSGQIWYDILYGAARRNITVSVTIKEVYDLLVKQNYKCALTGWNISLPTNNKAWRLRNFTASLDRIDSTKNYSVDNIQWLHKDINRLKREYKQEQFVKMCKAVADFSINVLPTQ